MGAGSTWLFERAESSQQKDEAQGPVTGTGPLTREPVPPAGIPARSIGRFTRGRTPRPAADRYSGRRNQLRSGFRNTRSQLS